MMDKEPEIWKPVNNYETFYKISNHGRLKSLERTVPHKRFGTMTIKEKILKGEFFNGYIRANLNRNRNEERIFIHRLVAQHFIPNPDNKPEINHKDGNKSNNYYKNLEWCTVAENQQHAVQNDLSGNTKLSMQDIPTIRKLIQEGLSDTQIGNKFDVHRRTINDIRRNQTWAHL